MIRSFNGLAPVNDRIFLSLTCVLFQHSPQNQENPTGAHAGYRVNVTPRHTR
jgi:hypothetical protein